MNMWKILLHTLLSLAIMLSQVQNILKYLYPVPKPDSKRVITFANHEDYISFRLPIGLCFSNYCTPYRHHVYKKSGHKEIELKEVGPRFELRC